MAPPKTHHIHIRASDATKEKLDWLALKYGTMSQAIAVAIDRLYQSGQFSYSECPQCHRLSLIMTSQAGTEDETWFCRAGCGFMEGPESMPT